MAEIGTFTPVELYAGDKRVVTDWGTFAITTVARSIGLVLGKITKGAVTAAADESNTGNGTCTPNVTEAKTAYTQLGDYTATATAATKFDVYAPDGAYLGVATAGTEFANQIKFTIAAGSTAFVAGDKFTITVAAGSGYLQPVNSANVDGSQNPYAVLIEDLAIDTAVQPCAVALAGEFNENALTFGGTDTADTHKEAMRELAMYIKPATAR